MSVAFWSVLLLPTSHRLPLPLCTGRGLAQTRVFRPRSLLLAHSPCPPVHLPIITVSLPFLGAEERRSGPGLSDKSGHQRRARTPSGPGRETWHLNAQTVPVVVLQDSVGDSRVDTHLGSSSLGIQALRLCPLVHLGHLVLCVTGHKRAHSSGHSVPGGRSCAPSR